MKRSAFELGLTRTVKAAPEIHSQKQLEDAFLKRLLGIPSGAEVG